MRQNSGGCQLDSSERMMLLKAEMQMLKRHERYLIEELARLRAKYAELKRKVWGESGEH